jgi:hypothetical protein
LTQLKNNTKTLFSFNTAEIFHVNITKYTGKFKENKKLSRDSQNELMVYAIFLKPDEYLKGTAIVDQLNIIN